MGVDYELGIAWLLLELVEGNSLQVAVAEHGPRHIPELLRRALNALHYLHDRGVVHGDLKPDNLRASIDPDDGSVSLYILDFGLATELREGRSLGSGTPRYMAPSVLAGGAATEATDLFALGKTFEDVLPSTDAEGRTEVETNALAHARDVITRLVELGPGAGYPTASAALSDLEAPGGDTASPHFQDRASSQHPQANSPRSLSPTVTRLEAPLEPPFLGREEVRDLLTNSVAELQKSQLTENLIAISGDPGIGKTRALRLAHRMGLLSPTTDVVTQPVDGRDAHSVALELAAQFLPAQTEVSQALSNPTPTSKPTDLRRAFQSLGTALGKRSKTRRLIWIADRAERASPDVIELIQILVATSGPSGPLILVGGRPCHSLQVLLSAERANGISLLGLPAATSGAIATAMNPDLDPATSEEIARLARGNPETTIALARSEELAADDASLGSDGFLARSFAKQTHALPRLELEVLQALAALDVASNLTTIAGAIQTDGPIPAIRRALRSLYNHGLVHYERGPAHVRYTTSGQAMRRWTLDRLDPDAFLSLHRRALEALRASGQVADEVIARVACRAGETSLAIDVGIRALRQLILAGHPRTASELADELISAVPVDAPGSADIRILATEALIRIGDIDEAVRSARALIEKRPVSNSTLLRARIMLAWAQLSRNDLSEAARQLDLAKPLLSFGSATCQRRFHERLGVLHWFRNNGELACATWGEGLKIEAPADIAFGDLHHDIGVVLPHLGQVDRATKHHTIALELRRELGDSDGESRSLICLGGLELHFGNLDAAERHYREALERTGGAGALPTQAFIIDNLALSQQFRGDLASALAQTQEALKIRERIEDHANAIASLGQLIYIQIGRGRLGEATDEARSLRRMNRRYGDSADRGGGAAVAAKLLLARGDTERCVRFCDAALARVDSRFNPAIERLAGEACLIAGNPDRARKYLDERSFPAYTLSHSIAQHQRTRAELALAEGRLGDAVALAEESEALARNMGSRGCITEALLTRARVDHALRRLDEAWPRLREATENASIHGGIDLQAEVWAARGMHALECGQSAQALSCFSRCVERWLDATRHLGGAHQSGGRRRESIYLSRPDRAVVLARIDALTASVNPDGIPRTEIHDGRT